MPEKPRDREFEETYAEFTAISIYGFFKSQPQTLELPFGAYKEHRKWLEKVCKIHKQKYGSEIEFHFKAVEGSKRKMCFFFKKKITQ